MDRAQRRRAAEMMRRLEELDRLDATYGLGTMPSAHTVRRAARRTRRRWWILPIVALALLSVVAFHPDPGVAQLRQRLGLGDEPLGTPPTVEMGLGSFAFLETQPDGATPVAYSPCRPVRYTVNPTAEPAGGHALVDDALAVVSAATGLVFEDAGSTDRRPGKPAGHSEPVLIAWSDETETTELRSAVAGLGGSNWRQQSGVRWYTTGEVVLDRDSFRPLLEEETPNGYALARAIVVHELAHLVGLAHVDDPAELMHSDNVGATTLGPGDREGLAALGRGACVG